MLMLMLQMPYLFGNMNLGPGGKQAILREGFIHAKQRPQSMVFPENHIIPDLQGKGKGIRQVLIE